MSVTVSYDTLEEAEDTMRIASTIARILLGLIFTAAGVAGYFVFHHPPPAPPGLASAFQDVYFRSGWVLFVDSIYVVAGVLMLVNRFVPLALVTLAGIITNIFIFHITMMPAGLPAPVVLTILWLLVAWPLRAQFAPLLAARAVADGPAGGYPVSPRHERPGPTGTVA